MRLVLTLATGIGLAVVPAALVRADDEKPKQDRPRLDAPLFDRLDVKDRKSTRLNSSHIQKSRMPSSA